MHKKFNEDRTEKTLAMIHFDRQTAGRESAAAGEL
jgi:hypothetical protein